MIGQKSALLLENRHPLLVGLAAGLVAGAVAGRSDKLFDRLVSKEHKRRERKVRKGSPHQLAGPHFAEKILGRKLDEEQKKRARLAFSVVYGVGWGLIHGTLRQRFPKLSRWGGLPFAVPFFFACDGFIAPGLGLSPNLRRIPWQPSLKEMGNHVVWTAAAELVHRLAARTGGGR
ncbi:MAG TPA: DUF1440 domain-containing protein [Geobacter sp.]|nr:DUF1440 domain-containing protein [Geobacter sp.]